MGTMREARLKAPEGPAVAFCHTISRVVNREVMPGAEERKQFVEMMRCHEHFCGVRVLTYCVMSNHIHRLVAVPRRLATLPGMQNCWRGRRRCSARRRWRRIARSRSTRPRKASHTNNQSVPCPSTQSPRLSRL